MKKNILLFIIVTIFGILGASDLKESKASQAAQVSPDVIRSIVEAAQKYDDAALNKILSSGVNINSQDATGQTALHYAILNSEKEPEAVKFLLNKKDINLLQQDNEGFTPLSLAIEKGDINLVKEILKKVQDPHAKRILLSTRSLKHKKAMLDAGRKNISDIQEQAKQAHNTLLQIPEKFKEQSKKRRKLTQLIKSIEIKFIDLAKKLGLAKARQKELFAVPIHLQVLVGPTVLKEKDLEPGEFIIGSLEDTVYNEKDLTSELRDLKAQIDKYYVERDSSDSEAKKMLAQIKESKKQLKEARHKIYEAKKELKLKAKKAGMTPLMLAANLGHKEIIRLLLLAGASPVDEQIELKDNKIVMDESGPVTINAVDIAKKKGIGEKTLRAAAQQWQKNGKSLNEILTASEPNETQALLLLNHCCIDVNYPGDTTSLEASVISCQRKSMQEVTKRLLELGADPDEKSVIVTAAKNNCPNIVKMLIEAGVDVNNTKDAKTALIEASAEGNLPIVQMLLNAGADVNITDYNDKDALSFAVKKNHKEIADLLIQKGAIPERVIEFQKLGLPQKSYETFIEGYESGDEDEPIPAFQIFEDDSSDSD